MVCLKMEQQNVKDTSLFFLKCFWLSPGNGSWTGTGFQWIITRGSSSDVIPEKIWKNTSCYLHVRWPSCPGDEMTKIYRSFQSIEPTISSCLYQLEWPGGYAGCCSIFLLTSLVRCWFWCIDKDLKYVLHLTYLILEGVIAFVIIDITDKSLTPSFSCWNSGIR